MRQEVETNGRFRPDNKHQDRRPGADRPACGRETLITIFQAVLDDPPLGAPRISRRRAAEPGDEEPGGIQWPGIVYQEDEASTWLFTARAPSIAGFNACITEVLAKRCPHHRHGRGPPSGMPNGPANIRDLSATPPRGEIYYVPCSGTA